MSIELEVLEHAATELDKAKLYSQRKAHAIVTLRRAQGYAEAGRWDTVLHLLDEARQDALDALHARRKDN